MRPPFIRVAALALGLTLLASSGAMLVGTPQAAAAGRTLSVTPAKGLTNEVVTVSWTGFRPTFPDGTYGVLLYQCKANPTRLTDCNQAEPFPAAGEGNRLIGFTSTNGKGSIFFEVRPADQLPELGCNAEKACTVLAFENDPDDPPDVDSLPASAVTAPIRFAPSPADCPPVADFDVRADGSASAAPTFYRWAASVCRGPNRQVIDYTETSSTSGRENFLSGLVDLGVSPVPPTDEELEASPDHPDYTYAPLGLTAVAVVVNMVDPRSNRRIENLVLSPRLMARLVTNSGLSTFLSDPELRTLNPGVVFPTVFSPPLLRAERDADSELVMKWMTTTPDARAFLANDDRFNKPLNPAYIEYAKTYPREGFEAVDSSDDQYLPRTGQINVARRMFYRVKPAGSVPETSLVGFIGIVDYPTALRFSLPVAKLVNAAGEAVAPTRSSILAAYRVMKKNKASTLEANLASTSAAAYPLVKIDYAMVPTSPTSAKAGQIARVLRLAAGDGQERLPPGYVPLPAAERKRTNQVAADLERLAPTPSTTTTATAATTTTAYTPYTGGGEVPTTVYDPGTDPAPTSASSVTTRPASSSSSAPVATTGVATPTIGPPALPVAPEHKGIPVAFGLSGAGLAAWGLTGIRQRRRTLRAGADPSGATGTGQ